jgi:hypothetical protein
MKLAAVALSVVALGGAGAQSRVLALDYDARQLAWFDPATLVRSAPSTGYQTTACSWSYSPDRRHVAVSNCQGDMRFIAVPSLKGEGRLTWSSQLGNATAVTWLRRDTLVAVSTIGSDLSRLVVIDPAKLRIVKRVDLDGVSLGRYVVGNSAVLLVSPSGHFGPPTVVVVGPDGSLRSISVARFSAGTVSSVGDDGVPHFETRTPGFAVDQSAARAYVVGRDLTVAAVDLRTGEVAYHGPVRTLAKVFDGWTRTARVLAGGLIAVSGSDSATTSGSITTTPFGLRVVDPNSWTARTIDPRATSFVVSGRVLLGYHDNWSAYDVAGAHLYDVPLEGRSWFSVQAGRGYVCDSRTALATVDTATGTSSAAAKGRPCPIFLVAPRSDN